MKVSPVLDIIKSLRKLYRISLHGISLSLGSADGISHEHLINLKELINIVDPFLVSERLSWNQSGGTYLPDLLPVPYTQESLNIFRRIYLEHRIS